MADLVHGSVAAPDKSPIQKWISKIMGVHSSAPAHMKQAAHAVRQYAEAGLVGGAFGALEATKPQHSDKAQLITAGVGLLGAVVSATEDYAVDLRNIGSDALAIYSFRKGKEMVEKKRLSSGAKVHGEESDVGEDPIVAAARNL